MTAPPGDLGSAPLKSVLAMWDALVEHWDLDESERSSLLGGFEPGSVADVATYDHAGGERRMRLLVELSPILDRVHGDRGRTLRWLRAPNRHLGDAAPIEVMASSTAWTRWLVDHVGLTT